MDNQGRNLLFAAVLSHDLQLVKSALPPLPPFQFYLVLPDFHWNDKCSRILIEKFKISTKTKDNFGKTVLQVTDLILILILILCRLLQENVKLISNPNRRVLFFLYQDEVKK
jgi:hypothetical protein